jgi:hypothetical protein
MHASTSSLCLLAEDDDGASGAHLRRPTLDWDCERMARWTRPAHLSVSDVLETSSPTAACAAPGQSGTDIASMTAASWCDLSKENGPVRSDGE